MLRTAQPVPGTDGTPGGRRFQNRTTCIFSPADEQPGFLFGVHDAIIRSHIVRDKDTVKNDVYVADVTGGGLSRAIRIMENVKMPAVISLMAHWSDDSGKLYIKMPASTGETNLVDKIQEFVF